MAEAKVQSSIIKDACNKAIEKENLDYKFLISEAKKTQKALDSDDLFIESLASFEQFAESHHEKISKLESILFLAELSGSIQINENDVLFLNPKCEGLK